MEKSIHILFFCFTLFYVSFSCAQKDTKAETSFEKKIEIINIMCDNQMYTKAMTELEALEQEVIESNSVEKKVEFHLMKERIFRITEHHADAMNELNKLPNLSKYKKLELRVDFRKAASFSETPIYTMDEKILLASPIIKKGIANAESLGDLGMLASFLNLKATMYRDECANINRNCKENHIKARKLYSRSAELFLATHDTLNYHNVLNGIFRLEIEDRTNKVDSLSKVVQKQIQESNYAPNLIVSHELLGAYFLLFKKDSVAYLKQLVLARDVMVDLKIQNSDNSIRKMKLLYEFDSLKSNINFNKDLLGKQNQLIKQKNRSITQTIFSSVALGILLVVLVFLFFRQKKMTKQMNATNNELQISNHNFQLLVRESNHRIKNNLQMILSMLELDKQNLNQEGFDILTTISSKIATITALHRILDFKEHNQRVLLKSYFDEIINYYIDLSKNKLVFTTDFANLQIQSERIIYFGLVLNEMVSNTLKHRKEEDEIVIQVLQTTDSFVFIYRDNSSFGEFTKSNGIQLIEGLIARLNGNNLQFNPKLGEYKFYFNE